MNKCIDKELTYFKKTGFFKEKDVAIKHLRDADEILTSGGINYCLMFGTLLGLLRHNDFIPWDDDLDIIIFDIEKFENECIGKFEDKWYVVLQDIRMLSPSQEGPLLKVETRCGYRIYLKSGKLIPNVAWKFPWLGIWEPVIKEGTMILPPEKFVYNIEDFFPLQRKPFNDFSVMIPNKYENILNHYFGEKDWMEYCMPSTLDHRQYRPTGFPDVKRPLKEVMEYLSAFN